MGGHEKSIQRGRLLKKWGRLGQFADLRGGVGKKEGSGVFDGGGGLIPQCTLCFLSGQIDSLGLLYIIKYAF